MSRWSQKAERAREAGLDAFRRIQAARPDLRMSLDLEPEHVDLILDIPAQPGLAFPVHLNQQNIDELYLCAGDFTLSWFPCTEPRRFGAYVESVLRLLDGTYRILEWRRGSRVVRADLEAPGPDGWQRIGRSEGFSWLPWPPVTQRVLQNVAGPDQAS